MAARTSRAAASGGTDVKMSDGETVDSKGKDAEAPVADTVGDTLALDAHAAPASEVAGDPTAALSTTVPGVADPVKAATLAAAKKARSGSSTQPLAGESVVMGADGRGAPVAVSSSPNPTTSAEIQEASAAAVLRMTENVDLVDEQGNELSGELFEDRFPASNVVYSKQRIYKTTLLPHSTRATSVLLYAAHVAVPRGEAEAFQRLLDE
jgi:hypothetical protein